MEDGDWRLEIGDWTQGDSRQGTFAWPPSTVYFYRLLRLPEELALAWQYHVSRCEE
jgi:hypothetical protein